MQIAVEETRSRLSVACFMEFGDRNQKKKTPLWDLNSKFLIKTTPTGCSRFHFCLKAYNQFDASGLFYVLVITKGKSNLISRHMHKQV